jgi:hypothetical protein
MKYKFTERVETGYSTDDCVGGTLYITLTFDQYIDKAPYTEIIDSLDHCNITNNSKAYKFNKRFYILKELSNIFEDVISILTERFEIADLKPPKSISVKLRNDEYISKPKRITRIDSMNFEG